MNHAAFDDLTRTLPTGPSRRAALRLFVSSALAARAGLPGLPGILAGKKNKNKKKKKTTLCLDGQTIQASKKKKKKLIKRGATTGACSPPVCTPSCAANACGGDDGCGGICGCAAGSVCHAGVCQACTVTCDGNGAACGNALQPFLNGGGTVVACPGRYVGNFVLASTGSLIGSGDGDDPATSTILDANGSGRVMEILTGVTASMYGVRVTGGDVPNSGGAGIVLRGNLTMTACTVHQNHSADLGPGGILQTSSAASLTLNDCVVSENIGQLNGGGIRNSTGTTTTINGSTITGNHAVFAGGIYNHGTLTFDGASRVTGNTADAGGGGIHNEGGMVMLDGATVSGNSEPQCINVMGC